MPFLKSSPSRILGLTISARRFAVGLLFCALLYITAFAGHHNSDAVADRAVKNNKPSIPTIVDCPGIMSFQATEDGRATLLIFDAPGQSATTLFDAPVKSGDACRVLLPGRQYPAGVYYYQLSEASHQEMGKFLLLPE